MDRYLYHIGYHTYPRLEICQLAIVSLLIAAKLEQPMSPSFNKMILLLSEKE